MAYLLDTGFLYATLNKKEKLHSETVRIITSIRDEIIFPIPAITETAYLISRDLGVESLAAFLEDLPRMKLIIESPVADDYIRASQIIRKYSDSNIDFVDACIVAMAERRSITKILTIDRRHFAVFRPAHCEAFEILP